MAKSTDVYSEPALISCLCTSGRPTPAGLTRGCGGGAPWSEGLVSFYPHGDTSLRGVRPGARKRACVSEVQGVREAPPSWSP